MELPSGIEVLVFEDAGKIEILSEDFKPGYFFSGEFLPSKSSKPNTIFMNSASVQNDLSKEELYWVQKVVPPLKKNEEKLYRNGITKRFFHPKMHGCLRAEFIVEKDLGADLRQGLFIEPKTYQGWIRLSNSNHRAGRDQKKNTRGMAIKLVDVAGERAFPEYENETTHDFILVNQETLGARNLAMAARAVIALAGNIFQKILYLFRYPLSVIKLVLSRVPCSNLLTAQYYSLVPFAFGETGRVVKYSVIPVKKSNGELPGSTPDFLRQRLVDHLSKEEAWFDFSIQFYQDDETTPIEDPSVPWHSPFIKVASIRIPVQEFDTEERKRFGENLSFNPWNSLLAHKPVGSINNVRKAIYLAMAAFRHERNGVPMAPPPSSDPNEQNTAIAQKVTDLSEDHESMDEKINAGEENTQST